jgi:hypothetical protein
VSYLTPTTSPTTATVAHITATDTGSGVKATYYTLDGSPTQVLALNGDIALGADGQHVITYWSEDNAGNLEIVRVSVLVKDTTAPELRYSPEQSRRKTANVTLVAKDNIVGVDDIYYWVEGVHAAGSESAPLTYVGPIELSTAGESIIHFWAVDRIGNRSYTETIAYNLDPDAPLTLPSLLPGTHPARELTFEVFDDSPTTTYYLINDEPRHPAAPNVWDGNPIELPQDEDGIYHITYWSVDDLGNAEPRKTVTYTIDTTAPRSTATVPSPVPVMAQTVHISAIDNIAGVKNIWYKFIPKTPATPQILAAGTDGAVYDIPFELTQSGIYELHHWAEDIVGNLEDEQIRTYTVDADAPVSTAKLVQPANNKSATLTLTSTDPTVADVTSGLAKLYYSINGKPYQTYTKPLTFKGDGVYAIDFYAQDKAGNKETVRTVVIHLGDYNNSDVALPDYLPLPPTGDIMSYAYLLVSLVGAATVILVVRKKKAHTKA